MILPDSGSEFGGGDWFRGQENDRHAVHRWTATWTNLKNPYIPTSAGEIIAAAASSPRQIRRLMGRYDLPFQNGSVMTAGHALYTLFIGKAYVSIK